jgi:hypothetical protein
MLAQFLPQLFEALMLICFGISWPAAIHKTLRTRRTEGKSLLFLVLVLIGYLAGIAAKLVAAVQEHRAPVWVTALYAINAVMVATDIVLFLRYRPKQA